MTHYTKEKKEHALTLMSAPQNKPVPEVSQLTGIPEATLYLWRKQARSAGRAVPGDGQNPEDWSAADKFAVVLETAPLGEAELAEYCRQKGLFVEQVRRWRSEAQMALGQVSNGKAERAQDKKRIRELEKDLRRKEKALAEAAALLVLSRKYEALRTDDEDA
jgi:transposase-like protein|nr:transposase [Noviherbaspirillum malthae]